jgi:hypothetical protein
MKQQKEENDLAKEDKPDDGCMTKIFAIFSMRMFSLPDVANEASLVEKSESQIPYHPGTSLIELM